MSEPRAMILIVDDSPEDRLVYRHYLADMYDLHEAELGAQGLVLCQSLQPDCVLLDYRLPDADGVEWIVGVQAQTGARTPAVILLTGAGNEAIAVEAMKQGAQNYLVKGQLTREALRRAVHQAIENITLRRQMQERETRLQLALEAARMGTWDRDLRSNMLTWSEHLGPLFGLPGGASPGTYEAFLALVHPEDREHMARTVARTLRGEASYELEFRTVPPEGRMRWIATRGLVVRDASGQAVHMTGVAMDITARKQAEEALQQAYADLERRVEERTADLLAAEAERQRLAREAKRAEHFALLGRLAAGVSHEIRNPLGAVFLHVDLLEEELRQPSPHSAEEIAASMTEIKTQLARVSELVQDYLSLVRVASIQRIPQDFGAEVEAWVTEVRETAQAHGVAVHLEGLSDLGQVAFHTNTLRRAVLNLMQNAIDAMPQGGTLTLTGQGTASEVCLHVQDTGIGVSAEQLAQIFEPLYTTKSGGTGLGLYIVQEIVASHGGQITVHSTEGQGTTFTITLQRVPQEPSTPLPR